MAEVITYVQSISLLLTLCYTIYLFTRPHPVAKGLAWLFLLQVTVGLGNRLREFDVPESWVNLTKLGYFAVAPVMVNLSAAFREDTAGSPRWTPGRSFMFASAVAAALLAAVMFLADPCAWDCTRGGTDYRGPFYLLHVFMDLLFVVAAWGFIDDASRGKPMFPPLLARGAALIFLLRVILFVGIPIGALAGGFRPGFGSVYDAYLALDYILIFAVGLAAWATLLWLAGSEWRWGSPLKAASLVLLAGAATLVGMMRAGFGWDLLGEPVSWIYGLTQIALVLWMWRLLHGAEAIHAQPPQHAEAEASRASGKGRTPFLVAAFGVVSLVLGVLLLRDPPTVSRLLDPMGMQLAKVGLIIGGLIIIGLGIALYRQDRATARPAGDPSAISPEEG